MSNCSFLRQKRQVLVNGEWVDTRTFRYFPHCDDENAYVNIVNGRPGLHIDVRFVKIQDLNTFTGYNWETKKAVLNNKGAAYIEMGKDECIYNIDIDDITTDGSYCDLQMQIHGCPIISIDSHDWTPFNISCELSISCTRFVSANREAPNVLNLGSAYSSITFTNFDTSNITIMNGMFFSCSSFKSIDLSSWNTSNATEIGGMFSGCSGLTSLDLSNFDTSKVTEMGGMFRGCSSLTNIDLSSFDTSKVDDMNAMFMECSSLTYLNLSNFNTSSLTQMVQMFYHCDNLQTLDLSGWDLTNLDYYYWPPMYETFAYCDSLNTIYMKGCNQTTIDRINRALEDVRIQNQVTIIT